MYKVLRNLLFLLPAEKAHYLSMGALRVLCSVKPVRKMLAKMFAPVKAGGLQRKLFAGLLFKNPVGLGAGFDKNARYLRELEMLGFGFVEIGTVTPKPQPGNDRPRLFRLVKDEALINRMGFNNDGVDVVAGRLKKWRDQFSADKSGMSDTLIVKQPVSTSGAQLRDIHNPRLIIGGNIGKNKNTSNEDAWKDYETCFMALHPYVDFFVVNVSSPNTPGLRALQEKEVLRKILVNLQQKNFQLQQARPILLKISPDLNTSQIDDIIDLAFEIRLDGLVATNTTISRDGLSTSAGQLETIGAGGLSGMPLKNHATEIVRYIAGKTGGKIPIIASGGIFSGDDAKEKLDAGASLVEVWTGFIYQGPGIVKTICKKFV